MNPDNAHSANQSIFTWTGQDSIDFFFVNMDFQLTKSPKKQISGLTQIKSIIIFLILSLAKFY